MAAFSPAPVVSAIVRQGPKLIVPAPEPGQPAVLPPPCIKCGNPADGKPLEKTFYWHNQALYLLVLVSPLIYLIVALIVRKRIRVRVPFCARHAKRRGTNVMLAWVLPVVGIADAVILPGLGVDAGIVVLVTSLLLLAGLIIWVVVSNPIRPTFIDQFRGDFIGFCSAYLKSTPEGLQPPAPVLGQPAPPPPPVSPN